DNIAGLANAATKADVAAAQNNAGRNLLHNGLFAVAQRGAGPWTTSGYTADRWACASTNGSRTITIVSLSDTDRTARGDETAQYAWQSVFTGGAGASDFEQVYQRMENVRR